MMSGWFASNTALDEQIDRATSSSLEDIALNLEISDVIRSKTVQPKEAMRSLKRRIGNKNPNFQLSALNLTDTCVKNGGSHFLTEVASREFMDNLVSLLKAYGPAATNDEVKNKILELIQSWATATEGRYELSYIGETYRNLQKEHYAFPPKVQVASSMVDSSAPPEWTDSDVCMRCRTPFSFTNRKHHCRNCGNVFDQQCSSKSLPLPHLGILQPVRVDDGCYAKLTDKSSKGGPSITTTSRPAPMQPRSARVDDGFDEDLKRALAMSLEEVNGHTNSGYAPQSKPQTSDAPKEASTNGAPKLAAPKSEEEEDEDLKAAIAASMSDMEEQKRKHAAALKEQAANSSNSASTHFVMPKNDYELSPVEAENINLFATLVDRLQTQPPGTILREPQIQELYESIGALRPKLARTYGETMSKHDTLLDLHAKLQTVVRYYDRMLEERLSNTYSQHTLGGYNLPPQRQTSNPYPSIASNATAVPGGAESFYTGNVAQGQYGRPQSTYGFQAQPYPSFDRRASMVSSPPGTDQRNDNYTPRPVQPQRTGSWQAAAATPYAQPPTAYAGDAGVPQQPSASLSTPSQPPLNYAPPEQALSPTTDPNAAFYFGNQAQVPVNMSQSGPVDQGQTPYPTIQSPQQQYQALPHSEPQQQPVPPQTKAVPPHHLPQQQPYWQAQQHTAAGQQSWQASPSVQGGYSQAAFPAAPQHNPQPQAVPVEESLIEL